MQKFVLFIVLLLSIFINVDKVNVSANSGTDPTADLWDYDISLDVYTTMQTYDTVDIYTDRFDNHIGYTKLYSGVVRRLDDEDSWVVINYAKIQPKDVQISWFRTLNSKSKYFQLISDIDGESSPGPYGSYYSSEGYDMLSPTPTAMPTMTEYNVGIQLTAYDPPVFAATTGIQDHELSIEVLHEWDEQVFNVKYNYSCHNLVFCSYMNSPTEQRAVYKIDSSGETYSPYRADFLQVITAISRFKVKDGVDSFYHTSSMSNTLKK